MRNLLRKAKQPFSAAIPLRLTDRIVSDEPVDIVQEDRLRVGIFRGTERCEGCDEFLRWLCMEFEIDGQWQPILTMDERNFPILDSVIETLKDRLGITR
jgi:hypothetical protein